MDEQIKIQFKAFNWNISTNQKNNNSILIKPLIANTKFNDAHNFQFRKSCHIFPHYKNDSHNRMTSVCSDKAF